MPEASPSAQERALTTAPGCLVSFDDQGRVTFANPELHRLLGVEAASLAGQAFDRLLSPASRVFHSTHVFPLLKLKGRVEEIFVEFQRAGRDNLPMLLSAARDVVDGVALNHCALLPMSQRKQLEAELFAAKRDAEAATAAKDQFLAVVSHELRSPLSAIQGWARIGLSEKADAAMRLRAMETIDRNTQLQSQLIDDLLDISRIVSGKMRISPRAMDLAPLIESVVEAIRPAAQARDIALQVGIERRPVVAFADPARMQQITWNLLSNAVKFTPKGGAVRVSLARVESMLRLDVADSGRGISADQLPFVFERFWQSRDTQSAKSGVGLGLSICKTLIELHGGTIEAQSGGLGSGSRFTVRIPLATMVSGDMGWSAAVGPDLENPLGVSLAGVRALVVDDNEDARALMRMLLEAAGADVRVADSYDAAVQALADSVPDVLLSDIDLRGRDGLELIRHLRSSPAAAVRAIPAIAVTGMARPQDRVAMLRAGFQAHLSKPIEPAEVTALVAALASRPSTDGEAGQRR